MGNRSHLLSLTANPSQKHQIRSWLSVTFVAVVIVHGAETIFLELSGTACPGGANVRLSRDASSLAPSWCLV